MLQDLPEPDSTLQRLFVAEDCECHKQIRSNILNGSFVYNTQQLLHVHKQVYQLTAPVFHL
jgi:hypothetical protein